jgi:hypothetical protein
MEHESSSLREKLKATAGFLLICISPNPREIAKNQKGRRLTANPFNKQTIFWDSLTPPVNPAKG